MLKINAIFHRKADNLKSSSCVVEKIISLTGGEFDSFASGMLSDWDFIKDNAGLMRQYDGGAYHCILVTGEGREDGIIVQSDGYDYARYAGHVPHVHSIIAANRYPTLAGLCKKLSDMADCIAAQGMSPAPGEKYAVVDIDTLEEKFDINLEFNDVIIDAVFGMLNERPEIYDVEIDKNQFLIAPRTPAMAAPEQAPEQGQTMSI